MSLVLRGGRVVDPRTQTDRVADLTVVDGKISGLDDRLNSGDGDVEVDVRGLVVGPGFIDLHSHVHSIAGHRLQALDGVTTALDLEAGLMPVDLGYRQAADEGRPLNYGFSASWGAARAKVLAGMEPDAKFLTGYQFISEPAWQRTSTPSERATWLGLLETELAAGALGIGVLLGYAPRTSPDEFLAVARLAASAGVPTYTHVRELVEADPLTPIDGAEEIVRAAGETGAAMHHCHVNASSRRHVDRVLAALAEGRRSGSRITMESYPYGAGSTGIGVSFLAPERLRAWGLLPSNVVVLSTGERVANVDRLVELRTTAPSTPCIVEFLDERVDADAALLHQALAFPDSIVASDAMPVSIAGDAGPRIWPLPDGSMTHPRTSGTFAKTIRLMVREADEWTWSEAFRRCSYLPSLVLADSVPDVRPKGHITVGADADLVVLNPATVTDNATFSDPTVPSSGIEHLLVNGTFVVRGGELVLDALPGLPLRGEPL